MLKSDTKNAQHNTYLYPLPTTQEVPSGVVRNLLGSLLMMLGSGARVRLGCSSMS